MYIIYTVQCTVYNVHGICMVYIYDVYIVYINMYIYIDYSLEITLNNMYLILLK